MPAVSKARAGQVPRAVPAAVEVSHLTKVFGGRTAVSDVSFSVAAGDYTYVIGGESQRAAISRVPGVTFLPFSATRPAGPYLLALRNLLASTSFTHSPRNVTQASDPAAAAAGMGPYYPRTAACPLATLTAKGPQACLG